MKSLFPLLTFLLLIFICFSCAPDQPPAEFIDQVDDIRQKWAPDKRVRVFNIDYAFKSGKWHISGETSVPEIQTAIATLVKETPSMQNAHLEFTLLPTAEIGDSTRALVGVSVANLRRNPGHSQEMVDQVVMGMSLHILKQKGYWYLVQTPSEYLGWITRGSIERLDKEGHDNWQALNKAEVVVNFCEVFSGTDRSAVVSDLVLGCVVQRTAIKNKWSEVVLPDGREGYVLNSNLRDYTPVSNRLDIDRNALISKARTMMGIPYLWGGNSTKGFDCSGFTGTIFRHFGYQLPRDANMQVKLGQEILPNEDYSNVLPGDLIFFGSPKRITHVGICLGGSYFIHASALVKVNSLDEEDDLFNAYRKNTFRHIKRLITN